MDEKPHEDQPLNPFKRRRWKIIFAVIGIVVISAALFTAPTGNLTRARQTTTLATSIAIESAVNNIYSEYGKIPDVGDRVTTDSAKGVKLLTILLGFEENISKPKNPRAIKFLSVKLGKDRKGGLIYDSKGRLPEGLFDPWGNPYTVILDTDYDEQLHFDIAGKQYHLKGRRVVVFSPGADHKLGTADDIKTWE